jgi:hypothetical protein
MGGIYQMLIGSRRKMGEICRALLLLEAFHPKRRKAPHSTIFAHFMI